MPDHGRVQHVSARPPRPCPGPLPAPPHVSLSKSHQGCSPVSRGPTWWGNRKQSPAEGGPGQHGSPWAQVLGASRALTGCVLGQRHFHRTCPPCILRPRGVCSQRHFLALVPPAEGRPGAHTLHEEALPAHGAGMLWRPWRGALPQAWQGCCLLEMGTPRTPGHPASAAALEAARVGEPPCSPGLTPSLGGRSHGSGKRPRGPRGRRGSSSLTAPVRVTACVPG